LKRFVAHRRGSRYIDKADARAEIWFKDQVGVPVINGGYITDSRRRIFSPEDIGQQRRRCHRLAGAPSGCGRQTCRRGSTTRRSFSDKILVQQSVAFKEA